MTEDLKGIGSATRIAELIRAAIRKETGLTASAGKTEKLNRQLLEQTEALQESEVRFRGLSSATFEGIAIHDQGRIVDANQAALDMLGYVQSEIEGLHIADLIAPEDLEIAAQHIQENYDKPYEISILHKDGSVLPVEVQGKNVPYGDRQVRVVAVRDISFRKQLQQQALALELEQARVEFLKNFFQNASHEFNTPLSIIRTSAYLMERADAPEKRQQSLDNINDQVERITKLVEDLLFLMKLDTDIEMHRGPTDVNALLRTTVAILNETLEAKPQQVVFQTDDRLPSVRADTELLGQSFYAILQNAKRYTPENGSITVRTTCKDGQIYVEIEDNGMGIAEEALAHIFDRFYRADEAHTTAGFGVGLAIARSIIELHQGQITVQSQPGSGSTFTVRLPIAGE